MHYWLPAICFRLSSPYKHQYMKELIDRLKNEAGLTEEQAIKAITMIKDFAKEKFPLFSGAIEKVFSKYAPKDDEDFLA